MTQRPRLLSRASLCIASLALAASAARCGPAPVVEAPHPAPPPALAPSATGLVTPARWLARHAETFIPSATHELLGGALLHGTGAGERWIEAASTAARDAGAADADAGVASTAAPEAAGMILPERISAIQQVDKRWAFFGGSGRVYLAASPLGPIEEVRAAPAPTLSVSSGRSAVFAVTRRGDLVRTTDGGAHWTAVPATGSAPAAPISVAIRADGVGVVVAAPQRGFLTTDDGASWKPLQLPGPAPAAVEVTEDGEIWLTGGDGPKSHHLGGTPPVFAKGRHTPAPREPRDKVGADHDDSTAWWQALSGRRVVMVGKAGSREPWKIHVSDLDREGEWKDIPELEGAVAAQVEAHAGEFVLASLLRTDAAEDGGKPVAAGSDGGKPAPYRLVLHRSKDGGASWTDDGELPAWETGGRMVPGPNGWLLVTRKCPTRGGGCAPLSLRTAAGRPFAPMEGPEDGLPFDTAFALDPGRHGLLAAWTDSDPKGHFQRWSLDGKPGKPTELPEMIGTLALGVDSHGSITLLATTQQGGVTVSSRDGGVTFDDIDIGLRPGLKPEQASLVGDRGLLADDDGGYWETISGGQTWTPVTGRRPAHRRPSVSCGSDGCAINGERRLGWDLAAPDAPLPPVAAPLDDKPQTPSPGGTALRCTAGKPRAIPRGLADLDELVTEGWAAGRLVVPVATRTNGVDLVMVTTSDEKLPVRSTSFFDTPPNAAAVGSQTDVRVTSAGVIGSRATYPVDRSGADVWVSPVSLEIAWWRPEAGGVERGRHAPPGKGQMRGTFSLHNGRHREEILSLTPDAVYFRPHVSYEDPTELFTFGAGGRATKASSPLLPYATTAVRASTGIAILDARVTSETLVDFGVADGGIALSKWTLGPPAAGATIVPLSRKDGAALVVAWPGPPEGPPHGYLVPLRPGDDPPEPTDLGLAAVLGEHPRVCAEPPPKGGAAPRVAPGIVHLRVAIPRGMRRPVLVEGGAKPILFHTEAALVEVPPEGPACVSGWVARPLRSGEQVILPSASPARSLWISMADTTWKGGVSTRDVTLHPLRCEEAPGLAIPASSK